MRCQRTLSKEPRSRDAWSSWPTTVHSLRLLRVLKACCTSAKFLGHSTCAVPRTSSTSTMKLNALSWASTERTAKCLWDSSNCPKIHGRTSKRVTLSSQSKKARSATSPTSACSSSWRKASTALSTSRTSAGPRKSSTHLNSAMSETRLKWWCSSWTRKTAA